MSIGRSVIRANRNDRRVSVDVHLDNKGKIGENSGLLATVTNEIHDVLRRHFCAHQIAVLKYKEPGIPARLKVRGKKRVG